MSTHPTDPFQSGSPNDPNVMVQPAKKSGWGCVIWGCLGTLTFAIVLLVASVFGAYYLFTKYTDDRPAEVPVVEWEQERLDELQARIDAFSEQVKSGSQDDETTIDGEITGDELETTDPSPVDADAPRELRLTSDEINALISANEELRGKAYVRIEESRLYGQITLPTDMIPGGKGRYFNADAEFEVSMDNGVLVVRLTSASVKGEPIPESFMEGLAQQNLAKDAYDDVETAELLRKFDKIEVVDDAIILQLREPDAENDSDETGASEDSDAPVDDADSAEPESVPEDAAESIAE
ncbi:MAG: hypothetical protein NXI28_03060 [bacterium]|nr:hypothetical protein [bacterium]